MAWGKLIQSPNTPDPVVGLEGHRLKLMDARIYLDGSPFQNGGVEGGSPIYMVYITLSQHRLLLSTVPHKEAKEMQQGIMEWIEFIKELGESPIFRVKVRHEYNIDGDLRRG